MKRLQYHSPGSAAHFRSERRRCDALSSAKDKRHLADDMATSETSLKNISPTGQEMEAGMSSF